MTKTFNEQVAASERTWTTEEVVNIVQRATYRNATGTADVEYIYRELGIDYTCTHSRHVPVEASDPSTTFIIPETVRAMSSELYEMLNGLSDLAWKGIVDSKPWDQTLVAYDHHWGFVIIQDSMVVWSSTHKRGPALSNKGR